MPTVKMSKNLQINESQGSTDEQTKNENLINLMQKALRNKYNKHSFLKKKGEE